MPEILRFGLFAFGLASVVGSSVLVVGPLRLGGAPTLVALWIVASGQVVLLAQALSLLDALGRPGFLLGHLLIAGATVAWLAVRPRAARRPAAAAIGGGLRRVAATAWDWRVPALPLLAAAAVGTALISARLAFTVPPNSDDALGYHLTRVGYYLQFRSLDHYPTDDPRQVAFPADGELLILWTVALLRSDRLANAVQLVAWLVCAAAVYGLGRRIGLGRRAALFGAGLFALLPQAVLQSTAALNDLLVASFVAACLLFLLDAARAPHPAARLALAGAAAGLAVGTKGTALLALPGLGLVFLLLFGPRPGRAGRPAGRRRRPTRPILQGLLLGGVAAALLGSYIYVQNWVVYGAPAAGTRSAAPVISGEGAVATLARTLFEFAFADLSGPLADPRARPLAVPLSRALAAGGERLFEALGIPTSVPTADPAEGGVPAFSFLQTPRILETRSGVGPLGGLMLAFAAGALIWPGRGAAPPRLLGLAALTYLAGLVLVVGWSPYGLGRFLLTACALAAPLLGLLLRRPTAWRQVVALALAAWGGATGLYVAAFHDLRPLAQAGTLDWASAHNALYPPNARFWRELHRELGRASVVGVYGSKRLTGKRNAWEYPFFGPRFTRTVLPLVGPDYAERADLRAPPPWTNEELLAAYRPAYIAVEGPLTGAEALPELLPGRCFELPLRHGWPMVDWELWRCEDRDPRSVVANSDFAAWPHGAGPFVVEGGAPAVETADNWWAEVAGGAGRMQVSRLEPVPGGEPFRLRLEYRAGAGSGEEAGIIQVLPLAGLPGRILVLDARVRADRPGAALLWLDDGVDPVGVTNDTTGPETLRLEHRLDPQAASIRVGLDASWAGADAVVEVRTILAIPH